MLHYVMKGKTGLTATSGYVVLDKSDRQAYQADARNLTLTREFVLNTAEGTEVVHLKQKLFSLSPTYMMTRNGEPWGTIKKSWGKYKVERTGEPSVVVHPSLTGVQYAFKRDGKQIAGAKRKLVSLSENCAVEIEAAEDAELVLASLVAIFDISRPKLRAV